MSFLVVFRPALVVFQPLARIVWMYVSRIVLDELLRFWPQRRNAVGVIVDVDVEAVRFVVVLHPSKDIVIHIAEEVDVWFHPPVVLDVLERRVLAEHAAVPPTHLVIRLLAHVLYIQRREQGHRLLVQVHIYPRRNVPVFGRNQFVSYFGVGSCSRGLFELFGKGLIVEEGPGVVELVVPSTLKVAHALQHVVELFIAD